MDHTADAARHRNLAVQYRVMAHKTVHESLRKHYLGVAEAFDSLANGEETLARKGQGEAV